MLCGFADRHEGFPLGPVPLALTWKETTTGRFGLEQSYGGQVLVEKLWRDGILLIKTLVPPEATQYLSKIKDKNLQEANRYFRWLKSPSDYVFRDVWEQFESKFDPITRARMLAYREERLFYWHERMKYIAAAMDGFPDDPNPSLWKRHVVSRWGRQCERAMFGDGT